jgi:hypothetical protein
MAHGKEEKNATFLNGIGIFSPKKEFLPYR